MEKEKSAKVWAVTGIALRDINLLRLLVNAEDAAVPKILAAYGTTYGLDTYLTDPELVDFCNSLRNGVAHIKVAELVAYYDSLSSGPPAPRRLLEPLWFERKKEWIP